MGLTASSSPSATPWALRVEWGPIFHRGRLDGSLTYLIDAHDGELLFHYSATAMMQIPVPCRGLDELDEPAEFFGLKVHSGFEMTVCLSRLNSLATFSDVLETLIDVAKVYYAGDATEREQRIGHIEDAYRAVGIETGA